MISSFLQALKRSTLKFSSPAPCRPVLFRSSMSDKENCPVIHFVKLSEHAKMPTRGTPFSAGYDLYSSQPISIPPMSRALVSTDLQIALPRGCYGRIAPRSGLAVKNFIDVGAGVIDQDYR